MANKLMTVETEYVTWENEETHVLSNEMYPVLTYAVGSTTFKGNVPNKLGRIYVEIECNDLCATAMENDPRLIVISSVDIVPPEGAPLATIAQVGVKQVASV